MITEVHGKVWNEADRPSLRNHAKGDSHTDKQNRKLLSTSGKVRTAVGCGECFKPRCVYSDVNSRQQRRMCYVI